MMNAHISENVPLGPLTTFKVGGLARFFSDVADTSILPQLFEFAKQMGIPVFVLGGGSNILVDDRGYHGLVIKMSNNDIHFDETTIDEGTQKVTAGAGVEWDEFVRQVVEKKYWGAENLSLIPGTVGGGVVQNIGAYGCEIKEIVEWVEVYDESQERLRKLSNAECAFLYRDSIFKHEGKKWAITRVQFRLQKNGIPNILYKDIAGYFKSAGLITPTINEIRHAVIAIRTAKFPLLGEYGTAGSFFKNPVVTTIVGKEFLARFPNATHYIINKDQTKLSAAWIIDNVLHMRGSREGSVGCWNEQALVIVNYGGATSEQIKNFVDNLQKIFFNETKITLECEVIFVDV